MNFVASSLIFAVIQFSGLSTSTIIVWKPYISDTVEFDMSRSDVVNFTINAWNNGSLTLHAVIKMEKAADIAVIDEGIPYLWLVTNPEHCQLIPTGIGEVRATFLARLNKHNEDVTIRIDKKLEDGVTFDDIERGCLYIDYIQFATKKYHQRPSKEDGILDLDSINERMKVTNRKSRLYDLDFVIAWDLQLEFYNIFTYGSKLVRRPVRVASNTAVIHVKPHHLSNHGPVVPGPTDPFSTFPMVTLQGITSSLLNVSSVILVMIYLIVLYVPYLGLATTNP